MSRLANLRRDRDRGGDINLSPLIDMIFILLIFFVVTTTFVKNMELDIERPGAASAERADQRSIRVAIDRSGAVFIDGQPVQVWMVQTAVRDAVADDRERPVLVVADRRVETGRLIEVVDQCRLAGARNVGVDVERTE